MYKPQSYAVKYKDIDVRLKSRSGGIFTALAEKILEEKGSVYGCVLTDDFEAIHVRASNIEECNAMRGSKYVQSSIGNTYKLVKEDLESKKKVLFTGTSCQISGLKGFLRENYDNLICVDIICHGVPSPLVWKRYLSWQEKVHNGTIKKVEFRNKKDFGWKAHTESLWINTGKRIDSEIFKTLFYSHMIVRPCCFKCPYKNIIHPGDITIGDYWGIEKAAPGFNDNKGVSLVLINNEKGNDIFNSVQEKLEIRSTELKDSLQPPLEGPYDSPPNRQKFWDDFYGRSFEYIVKKYGGMGTKDFLKKKIYYTKKVIKNFIKKG